MTRRTRIPIRGIGAIAPGAIGISAFGGLLASGRTAVDLVDRFDTSDLGSHSAALVRDFKPREFIAPMKMRRMNVLSRMTVAATKLAFDDAGIDPASSAAGPIGVALGSAFGPVSTSVDYLLEYVAKGPSLAPPQLFAESVANAPGSHVAIELGLTGFNVTFTQRSASAALAVAFAALEILKGTATTAVAGGVDEVHEITFAVLDRIGALAHETAVAHEAARPFDRRRNGLLLGEGAAMFVLGGPGDATPWGYVSGVAFGRDRSASISDWGDDDAAVVATMDAAVDDAGIDRDEIDAIFASANGSIRGDRLEGRALRRFGVGDRPPVVATKGYFGEFAAAGALQIAAALLALREQALPASIGYEESDEGLVLPLTRERRGRDLAHVLVNVVSEGGGIVSLVLSREDGE